MESEENEYHCSDCGGTISADTKICPNCGASLEEAPEEDDFVEVQISSEPSTISTIQSLLEENKIEYSINDNAMENVWGPSFTQVPRLLVRRDQADLVNQLLSTLETEDIEIIDSEIIDTEYKVGSYFSIGNEESGYSITKILTTDFSGVHISLYSNHYQKRPKKIILGDLVINSMNDVTNRTGAFHIPLLYESFEDWEPEFIMNGTVSERELEGYKIWKEEKGSYF